MARFPRVEQMLSDVSHAAATCELSEADAAFAMRAVKRFSESQKHHGLVTLDLNGHVVVRAPGNDGQLTELLLSGSRPAGQPLRLAMDRRYLVRALELRFRQLHVFAPERPVCCRDARRQYLWAPLGKHDVLPPDADAVQIDSAAVVGAA